MLTFHIDGLEKGSEAENIMNCLINLYATPAGSIPGDRDFGLSWALIDSVPPELEPLLSLELIEKTDQYEPRVKVTEVAFDRGEDGAVQVSVAVEGRLDAWQMS